MHSYNLESIIIIILKSVSKQKYFAASSFRKVMGGCA